ncbi:S-layer homology domain-containing protein [Cohnella soli]|uniref:S-layer homology domain-containing protein n=1 Tax=Cohnella soli TaxID=425005 RepID=A0ABW0HWQ3_9BACL
MTILLSAALLLVGNSVAFAADPIKVLPIIIPIEINPGNQPPANFVPIARPKTVPTVIAGEGHTVVLKSDGTVWAWGANNYGQLGMGTVGKDSSTPVQVSNLSDVVAIAAEGGQSFLKTGHTVALKSDGTVWTWGNNENGQLGIGTLDKGSPVPVQVPNLSDVVAITAGSLHTMALKSNGTVWAWGYNYYGQLGNGKTGSSTVPVQVSNLSGVISISAKYMQSSAVRSDGTVWTWGSNFYGQLGYDTGKKNNPTPKQVPKVKGIVSIAQGQLFTAALGSDGTVWTWGLNLFGSLGNGTSGQQTEFYEPQQVLYSLNPSRELSGVVSISAGQGHTLALLSDGSVWGWGQNDYGMLGNGNLTHRPLANKIELNGSIVAVGTGKFHSIAVRKDGTVWTWGLNGSYRLGYQASPPEPPEGISNVPRQVADLIVTVAEPIDNTPVQNTPLSDIEGHWAKEPIIQALNKGIASGYPDGTFKPDRSVSRAELAVLLTNALKPSGKGAELTFKDKQTIGSWAAKPIAYCVELGIINGYSDGTFRPNKTITHAEMVTMIVRAADLPISDDAATGYLDDADIPKYARSYIAAAKLYGITAFITDNRFGPNAPSTRAESVTAIVNMLKAIKVAAKSEVPVL